METELIKWDERLIVLVVPQIEKNGMTIPPEVSSIRIAVWPDPLFDDPIHVPVRAVYDEDESVYT